MKEVNPEESVSSGGEDLLSKSATTPPSERQPGESKDEPTEACSSALGDSNVQAISLAAAEDEGRNNLETAGPPVATTSPAAPAAVGAWLEKEPQESTDQTPHTMTESLFNYPGWRIVAASRRGKMHAHEGTFREDAFAVVSTAGWHIIAVADGAGSCRLSRVGAKTACNVAMEAMKAVINDKDQQFSPEEVAKCALTEGVSRAHKSVREEAERRQVSPKELSSTLLLLVHQPQESAHVVGTLEIGDGIIALEVEGKEGRRLDVYDAEDHGEYSGETTFLPSKPVDQWVARVQVKTYSEPIHTLAVMTDGIADDFFPFHKNLGTLLTALKERVTAPADRDQGAALLDLIGYEKRGSFDDRTLAIVYCQPMEAVDSTMAASETK